MKVLQVNCVYKTGSTGKIVADIHAQLLARGVDSVVCYGRGAKVSEAGVYKTCGELYSKLNNAASRVTGLMYGGCALSTRRLTSIICREKPDVVHLHCINGYFVNIYRLISWLKKHRVKTVLTLHAEFMYTANCGHAMDCERWKSGCGNCPRLRGETKSLFFDRTAASWKRMKAALDGFEGDCIVTSVSPWLMERAQQAPLLEKFRHVTVLNGVDTQVFHPHGGDAVREKFGLVGRKLALHVTAAFSAEKGHFKGGWYITELARRMPDVTFVVIGSREEVPDLPENVLNLGRVEDQQALAAWYSAADVTVITSERETFSMVVAESLCCGTPVVGFKAGGPETIAIEQFSEFVDHGDIHALENAVRDAMKREIAYADAAKEYADKTMTERYYQCYGVMTNAEGEN